MTVSFLIIFFSLLTLASSIMVVVSINLIYSILFLILSFFSAAGIIILLKLEFLGLIFLVLYVGAISVLFLFVVMMINKNKLSKNTYSYLPFGCFLGFIFIIEIFWTFLYAFDSNPYKNSHSFNYHVNWYSTIDSLTDISSLGQILYTYYILQFLLLGILLLMGLISSVVLIVNTKTKTREQHFFKQLARNYKNIYEKKNILF